MAVAEDKVRFEVSLSSRCFSSLCSLFPSFLVPFFLSSPPLFSLTLRSSPLQHRDLHLGQILVQPSSTGDSYSPSGPFDSSSGLETTIIDFGLSRVDAPSSSSSTEEEKVWWTPLDEEIFEGKGSFISLRLFFRSSRRSVIFADFRVCAFLFRLQVVNGTSTAPCEITSGTIGLGTIRSRISWFVSSLLPFLLPSLSSPLPSSPP